MRRKYRREDQFTRRYNFFIGDAFFLKKIKYNVIWFFKDLFIYLSDYLDALFCIHSYDYKIKISNFEDDRRSRNIITNRFRIEFCCKKCNKKKYFYENTQSNIFYDYDEFWNRDWK